MLFTLNSILTRHSYCNVPSSTVIVIIIIIIVVVVIVVVLSLIFV